MSGQLPPWAAQAGATPEGLQAYRRRRQAGAPLGEEPITLGGRPVGGMQAMTPDQGQDQLLGREVEMRSSTPDQGQNQIGGGRGRVRGGGRGGQTARNRAPGGGGASPYQPGNSVMTGPAAAPGGGVDRSGFVDTGARSNRATRMNGSIGGNQGERRGDPGTFGGGASGRSGPGENFGSYDPAAEAAAMAAKGGSAAPVATPLPGQVPTAPRPRRPVMSPEERAAAVAADRAMFEPGGSQSTLPAPPPAPTPTPAPQAPAVDIPLPAAPDPVMTQTPPFNPNQLNPRFPNGAPPFNPDPDPNAMKQVLSRARRPRPGGSGPFVPPNQNPSF